MLIEWHNLAAAFVLITGLGMFLRVVGKELNRRERHLRLRLEEKLAEIKQREEESRQASTQEGNASAEAGVAG